MTLRIGDTAPNFQAQTTQGAIDFATRLIAAPLGSGLGQQVIVDNRGLLASEVASNIGSRRSPTLSPPIE